MDATETSVERPGERLGELDLWLQSCDICIRTAINPVATNCGHLFCWSCLNEAFQEEPTRRCPACTADLREETVHRFPIDGSATPAEPTVEPANSDIAIPNAPTPLPARFSLISNARMDVVQDYLDKQKDRTHTMQMDLSRRLCDMRKERIRELQQVVENLVQMNLALLREVEDRDQDRRRMSRPIAELENPTVHGAGEFAMQQRRFGRRITPAQIAINAESVPESVESTEEEVTLA